MSTLNIQSLFRKLKRFPKLSLFASGSNYPCLERISMVPKIFEPLRFDCISISNLWMNLPETQNCLYVYLQMKMFGMIT